MQAYFSSNKANSLGQAKARFAPFCMPALKSAVDQPMNRKFLGLMVSRNGVELKVANKAIGKLKDRVRELTRRTRGKPLTLSLRS